MGNISTLLRSIREVDGVYGSFLLSQDGAIIDSDMPALFDREVLTEAGGRMVGIFETFASVGDDVQTCMLRFTEHKLYARQFEGGYMCALVPLDINMPTLRMATRLVARRLNALTRSDRSRPTGSYVPPTTQFAPAMSMPGDEGSAAVQARHPGTPTTAGTGVPMTLYDSGPHSQANPGQRHDSGPLPGPFPGSTAARHHVPETRPSGQIPVASPDRGSGPIPGGARAQPPPPPTAGNSPAQPRRGRLKRTKQRARSSHQMFRGQKVKK